MVVRGRREDRMRLDELCTVRKNKKRSNEDVMVANGKTR